MGPRLRLAALLAAALAAAALPVAAPALPLWELRGKGSRIFILGSVHLLRAADHPLPAALDRALAGADVIYLELDLDDPGTVDAGLVAGLAIDPDGRPLRELLGETAWRDTERRLRGLGLDSATVAPFEPWYAALAITQARLAQLGFDGQQGVEAYVARAAATAGKDLRGLETLAEQLAALDGLSPAAQRRFLATTLDEAATVGDEVDTIIAAWRRGDSAALESSLLGDLASEAELYRRVVVDRNDRFAATIRALANGRENVLVVVGTLHLVGPDGVIERLRAAGLEPRPVD